MDPDLELLDRWCAGNQAAGNALFKRYFEDIYRFFENKVSGDIDEPVQETFLACVRRRDEFRRQSSFRTFIFAIARYELYAYWRRRSRGDQPIDFTEISLADLATTPISQLAREEDRERLVRALRSLPLEQQLFLELHYWENLDSAQLAEVFDIAPTTARTRLFRARQALRERLEAADSPSALQSMSNANLDTWVSSLRAKRASLTPDRPDSQPGGPRADSEGSPENP